MIHRAINIAHIHKLVDRHKPKIVILCGRHEPIEPSWRVMKGKVDDEKQLHEVLGDDVLVVGLPRAWQPYNYGVSCCSARYESRATRYIKEFFGKHGPSRQAFVAGRQSIRPAGQPSRRRWRHLGEYESDHRMMQGTDCCRCSIRSRKST